MMFFESNVDYLIVLLLMRGGLRKLKVVVFISKLRVKVNLKYRLVYFKRMFNLSGLIDCINIV